LLVSLLVSGWWVPQLVSCWFPCWFNVGGRRSWFPVGFPVGLCGPYQTPHFHLKPAMGPEERVAESASFATSTMETNWPLRCDQQPMGTLGGHADLFSQFLVLRNFFL